MLGGGQKAWKLPAMLGHWISNHIDRISTQQANVGFDLPPKGANQTQQGHSPFVSFLRRGLNFYWKLTHPPASFSQPQTRPLITGYWLYHWFRMNLVSPLSTVLKSSVTKPPLWVTKTTMVVYKACYGSQEWPWLQCFPPHKWECSVARGGNECSMLCISIQSECLCTSDVLKFGLVSPQRGLTKPNKVIICYYQMIWSWVWLAHKGD